MKVVYYVTWLFVVVFWAGETVRRGVSYFAVNATTMIEDYLCGALLLAAVVLWSKKHAMAQYMMVGAWGYATGGMFVPFAAHLEAWIREETFRADHPHEDFGSVVLKGVIWAVCLICFIISLKAAQSRRQLD